MMKMKSITTDVVVIGAGPAGMSAAISAACNGARVVMIDENKKPGGQLFKQIHKFFGSEQHNAGTRGFMIAEKLLQEVKVAGIKESKVKILLDSVVFGIFPGFKVGVTVRGEFSLGIEAKKIIVCTGAAENALAFENSTLPGVIGAGAAQTLANIYKVAPGKRVLMVGSGNVGLIVSYQLLQAGMEVAGIVEMADKVGGYMVHASKIARAGVPIMTRKTIVRAIGESTVTGAVIADVDSSFKVIPNTEQELDVDLICLAVGLRPLTELCWMMGCEFVFSSALGGLVPKHNRNMETTIGGLYIAGDISGIEEASVAMEEGTLAGIAATESLGYLRSAEARKLRMAKYETLSHLRSGCHGEKLAVAKNEICGRV